MDAMNFLENYYHNHDEENRLLSRHGIVDYLTTMHYVEKYLFPGQGFLK